MLMSKAIEEFSRWRGYQVKKSTVKGYDLYLKQFCLFVRNPHVETVVLSEVIKYLDLMTEVGYDPNSFMPRCVALRKFYQYLKSQNVPVFSPDLIPIPQTDFKIPHVAKDEDIEKVLSVIPKGNDPRHIRNKALIGIFRDTGMRNGEAVSINIEDVNLAECSAVIKTEKSKSKRPYRYVKWSGETNALLMEWLKKRTSLMPRFFNADQQALFLSVTGTKAGRRLSNKGVDEMLRRYSHLAKLDHVLNPHSFRHRFVHDRIYKEKRPMPEVRDMVGHSSIVSLQSYTKLNDTEIRDSWDRLHA